MIARNYKLIQDITIELKLNDGKGFSIDYIKMVLSDINTRKNEEIEIIASAINEATVQVQKQLLENFESYREGKAHWVRVIAKRLNETQVSA